MKKSARFRALGLLLFILLALVAPAASSAAHIASNGPSGSGPVDSGLTRITLLFTSDLHGRLEASAQSLGLARIASVREAIPGSLLVDAGDFMQGAPLANLSRGRDALALMKLAGYFAVTAGNHEFDYGVDELLLRYAESSTPPVPLALLSSNVQTPEGALLLDPGASALVDGVKLCLFGLTTPETALEAVPGPGAPRFADPLQTAGQAAARLRGAGCDLVVALTHLGYAAPDFPGSAQVALTPGIDLVIDGHAHEKYARSGPGAPVLSPGAHGAWLGLARLDYDKSAGQLRNISVSFLDAASAQGWPEKPEVKKALAQIKRQQEGYLEEILGQLPFTLYGAAPEIRLRERNFGSLLADLLRREADADFALVNAGSIRSDLPQGPLSRGALLAALPYEDPVVRLTLSGRELHEVIEHGLARLPVPHGSFPQVSGLVLRVRADNPPGQRLLALNLPDGSPIQPESLYTLTVSAFMASGGDGFPHLAAKKREKQGRGAAEIFLDWLQNQDASPAWTAGPARIIFE